MAIRLKVDESAIGEELKYKVGEMELEFTFGEEDTTSEEIDDGDEEE